MLLSKARKHVQVFRGTEVGWVCKIFGSWTNGLGQGKGYGLYQGLTLYLYTYFWGFSSKQIGMIMPISLFGLAFAVPFARKVARIVGEKRDTWIYASIWSLILGGVMVLLRLFDLLPDNGHP